MNQSQTFYEILGVSQDASQDQIRTAYRRLAVKFHPDKNAGNTEAEERFKELGQAYAVLSDPGQRARYDQQLRSGFPGGGFEGGFGGAEGISIDEILRRYGDMFGDAFGGGGGGGFGPFGGFGRGAPMQRRGRDVEASVTVPFREATLGSSVSVTLHDASGRRTLSVTLPRATNDGATLRLKGQGESGSRGGPAGDLFLRVRVKPDPVFRRRGKDLEADLKVPAPIAVLGGKVTVETLEGRQGSVTVPPGTSSGTLLRLKEQGIQGGDHLARVVVTVPKEPTDEERALYQQLSDLADE